MTDDLAAEIALHRRVNPTTDRCIECRRDWPCPLRRLADERGMVMPADVADDDLAAEIADHRPSSAENVSRECLWCDEDWPCLVRRLVDRERAVTTALLTFIHAYANTERVDHDRTEVRLFEAWLRGCAALGIKPAPTQPAPEREG
jgi:hypothetical protein